MNREEDRLVGQMNRTNEKDRRSGQMNMEQIRYTRKINRKDKQDR